MRRSIWALSALSLLVIVPVIASDHGRQLASAVSAAMADPASLLDQRSPGVRDAGALTQTKQRRLASHRGRHGPRDTREPFVPVERVLAGERRRPVEDANVPGFIPENGIDTLLPGEAPTTTDAFTSSVGGGGGAPSPVLAGVGGGGLGGGSLGGGSGGGGGTGGGGAGGASDTNPQPVTPVPEPATWMLTLTGFAALALVLRRRVRRVDPTRCDPSQG